MHTYPLSSIVYKYRLRHYVYRATLSHKMKLQLYFLLLIAFIFAMSVTAVSVIDDDGSTNSTNSCVTYLFELEASLKSNPLNIESIDDGFFPPNSVISVWVTVNIYYNTSTENHDVITTHPYNGDLNDTSPDVVFNWFETALFLSFKPDILVILSGLSYFLQSSTRFGVTNIVIHPLCQTDVTLLQKLVLKVCQHFIFVAIYVFMFLCFIV